MSSRAPAPLPCELPPRAPGAPRAGSRRDMRPPGPRSRNHAPKADRAPERPRPRPRARAHEGEQARPLLDESGGQVGCLDPGAAPHDRDLEGGRAGWRVEGLQERGNVDLGLVGHDGALPQDQLVGARRRAVLGDRDRVAPRQRAPDRPSVAHGRAQHDDPRIRAQVVGDAQQTTHDQRNVRASHASPMVGLVDDNQAQRGQEPRPALVRRQHHVVQEIRVRQDQIGARASPLLRLARRVPVHGRRAHAAQPLIDEALALFRVCARLRVGGFVVLAEQRHERGQLIRRQSLRRSQIQGRRTAMNRGNARRILGLHQVREDRRPRGQGLA